MKTQFVTILAAVVAALAVYAAYNEIKVTDKAIGNGIGMTHSCSGYFYDKFGKWVKDAARKNENKACGGQ